MVNVSTAWLRALANDQRDYQITISMTLANGVSLTIRNQHIWQNSFGIDDAVSADNDFQIGAAIINKCNFSLNNMYGDFDTFDFLNARLSVTVGLMVEGSLETIRKGSFVIVNNPTYNGALINIEAYDYMYFFDVPYSQNNTVYPTTADVIVRDMCTDLGVPLNTYDFPNKTTTISERPTEEATTYREVLSYIGQICGCYARCNVYGQLELKWYDQDALDSPTYAYDGGSFDADTPYATGDVVNGGVFNPWETGDVAEGGTFSWNSSVHFISSVYSRDISTEDVVITGIRILVKTKENDSSEETIKEFLKGTTGYVIEISENPFINISNADAIATRLANAIVGFKFRKASISHGSDPSIEAGDVAFVFDRKQNVYPIVISHTIFKNGSEQQTYSAAQDVYKNVAARYSAETKNYVDLRRRIKNERTSREEVEAALRRSIASASGLHETEIVDETSGATLRYLHNKPELAESDIQILVSDVGITVTADSGEHWYGLRVNGDLIARILTATGVNADWINTGQLVIRDQQGNVTFYADTETGTVRIVASEFSLTGGSTIQSIANQAKSEAITSSNAYADTKSTQALDSAKAYSDEKLGDYKDEVSAIIDGIQDQLDGAIETWYYDYQPTLNNYPASDWTTETDRKTHEGDLFYWKSTGYSYRFLKNDTTGNWEWQIVQDTGISTAIAKAEAAQDTADHKRRVFITQPIPPYDKGDLWSQGENGDLMRCTTARASGTYVASDWTRASRYTDDSALNSFVNNTYSSAISSIQGQLDQKVNTYYQESDPSVNWTSAELSEHVGDMWFNSSSLVQKYYRWNGASWSELTATPPAEVFDQIDGKAQIFVSTPTTPYNVGDLWFDSTTSDIMTCVTARTTGDYVATDWQKRNKYTDDTAVNNLEIGGRNLLAISNKGRNLPYTFGGITLSYDGDGWFRVSGTWERPGGAYIYIWSYSSIDSPWQSGTYTLTVENDNLLLDNVLHVYYSTGIIKRVPVGSTTIDVTTSLRAIGLYFVANHSGMAYNGRFRLKLERGNKATTDWTPAPEDLENEIANLGTTLQNQIDGKIQTYVQATNPATWSASERSAHNGDLWYYTGESDATYKNNTTYIYRASSDSWAAYAVSPDLFDMVDGKSQVFTEQPSPPYQEGDLWVQGANGDIYRCVTSRSSGSYNSSDWDRASKYTDDSALNDWINGEFASTIQNVRGQIDGKADTYYQARNPALDWNTDALKSEHVSDLWYCSASSGIYAQKYWRYSEDYEWQEITADVPDEVFDTINNKAQIFVGSTNPAPPYNVGDLWFNSTADGAGDIYTCVTSRAKGSMYSASDWAIRNKYTDDSVAKAKYGKCTTDADVIDKKVTIQGFKLFDGAMITVFFSHSNTAENPTLNVNGTGAMPIWVKGAAITSAHYWRYTDVVDFVYSEGHWEAMIESQEEIFNRLTNYGQIRGIYMQDGQLYVNATYILVGTMSADRVRGGTFAAGGSTSTTSQGKNGIFEVFNSDDERIVRIDANGIRVGNIVDALSKPNIYMRKDGYFETNRFRATGYVRIAGTADTSYKSYLKIPVVNSWEEASDDCYFEVGENGTTIKTHCYMPLDTEGSVFTEANATLKVGGILQRQLYNGYGRGSLIGGYVCACTDTLTTDYINDYVQITPFRIQLFNKQRSSSRVSIDSNQMLVMNSNGTKKVELNLTDGVWTQLGGHFGGSVTMASSLYVSGDKHRLVETEDYGKRVLYCYETTSPVFGDIGEGVIGEDGKCYISIDAILAETINSSEYQVFLQKYGDGDCYVSERKSGYFVVSGTPGMSFGWELKAKQYDAMQKRLENTDLVKTPSEISNQVDYANQAEIHINQILNERIPQNEGSNVSDTL